MAGVKPGPTTNVDMVLTRHATPAEMQEPAEFTVDGPAGSVDDADALWDLWRDLGRGLSRSWCRRCWYLEAVPAMRGLDPTAGQAVPP